MTNDDRSGMKGGGWSRGRVCAMVAAGLGVVAGVAPGAWGQLRRDEVLVVYDRRVADSLAVAEYYAGSRAVPGGAGNLAGVRRGVRVVDLADLGAPAPSGGDISYADFIARLRTPLRTYLTTSGLAARVRCLVTTKGLPHRIQDTDFPTAGDSPGQLVVQYNELDATCASVDGELTLLWQDLTAGEVGGPADSKADGVVLNPYWKSAVGVGVSSTANMQAAKTFQQAGTGPTWSTLGAVGSATRIGPGDMYLVCRLDAPTVADVRGMIDRAAGTWYDIPGSAALLDESDSNGIADVAANTEFDNVNTAFSLLYDADDYERTRDELTSDGRFPASYVRYNALGGGTQFFIGPRVTWQPPGAIMVTSTVVLVASFGSNHTGRPRDIAGTLADTFYATSYNYQNGAIFNSLESYNGRDFAGLGQNAIVAQQQASSFLSAGGTYAVCNVWEPLADSVPDNRYLARNFLRGNLSWAEAAWSAIPGLSWMQMAVGDPLGRPWRSSEDMDANQRVNTDDLYGWEASPRDINGNSVADATDRAFIVNALRTWERADMLEGRR